MLRKDCCWVTLLSLFALNILRPVLGDEEGSGTTLSPFEDCNEYPLIANSFPCTGGMTHGTVLTVICNSGYVNTGAEQMICVNGEWMPHECGGKPYCARQCTVPSLANGHTCLTDNGCSYESCTIVFTCDTGYTINGPETLTCQASGSWGDLPTCQIVDCNAPTLSNGAHSGPTTYGSEVTFQCANSFYLAGPPTASCGADGSWTDMPSCMFSCGLFPSISNAILTYSCSGQQLVGCTVVVSCVTGCNLTGNSFVPCIAGIGWGSLPGCVLSTSGVSNKVNLVVEAPSKEGRPAFEAALQASLLQYYNDEMGDDNLLMVAINSITYVPANASGNNSTEGETGEVALIDYTVSVAGTPEANGEFSSAQGGLVTTETLQVAGETIVPLEATYDGLTLKRTNGSEEAVKEASCRVFTLTNGPCPDDTQCQVYGDGENGNYTACEPVSQADDKLDDFDLKVALGVGIPLFLLACALAGVMTCCCCLLIAKRRRRWRRKEPDYEESDTASRSGFFLFTVPTMFVPYGRQVPFYGSSMYGNDDFEDARSVRSDDQLSHRDVEPEQSQIASNSSWKFLYPNVEDRLPRPEFRK